MRNFSSAYLLVTIAIVSSLLNLSQQTSFVQLFGMSDLLTDLGKIDTKVTIDNETSLVYYINPDIFDLLKKFKSRTQFCDYKCPDFYNFPCFILFGCNIQIRNFAILIIMPLAFLVMLGLCCGRGIWTFRCWGKYLALFSGVLFIAWLVQKCVKGNKFKKRKQKIIREAQDKLRDQIDPASMKRIRQQKQSSQSYSSA